MFGLSSQNAAKRTWITQAACWRARGKPMAEMVRDVVEAFVDAKMARTDISTALYRIAADVGGPALVRRTGQRSQKALEEMLRTAPDAVLRQEKFAIQMVFAAMARTMRSMLEAGASPAMVRNLRDHLVLLCQSYLVAATQPRRCDKP